MSRKVLLIEPNYKNKYPPMSLMKLATYFRNRGDDVRFYKGNMQDFAVELICEDLIKNLNICFSEKLWNKYYPVFFKFIKIFVDKSMQPEQLQYQEMQQPLLRISLLMLQAIW